MGLGFRDPDCSRDFSCVRFRGSVGPWGVLVVSRLLGYRHQMCIAQEVRCKPRLRNASLLYFSSSMLPYSMSSVSGVRRETESGEQPPAGLGQLQGAESLRTLASKPLGALPLTLGF